MATLIAAPPSTAALMRAFPSDPPSIQRESAAALHAARRHDARPYTCAPNAHRYVDLTDPPEPELLACYRCGRRFVRA